MLGVRQPHTLRCMDWNALAALAAAASAGFAAWQLWESRRESRLRSTFEHLREIESRVQAIRHVPPAELCQRTRDAYAGKSFLDEDCKAYLALLDSLELLAMARRLGAVETPVVDNYLAPVVRRELVSLSALTDFRTAWNEPKIYGDLGELLVKIEQKGHRLVEPEEK